MNNGGDFQSGGASRIPEAHGSQLEAWIGARAHVFSTVFVGTFETYPPEELMKPNKASLATDISCCLHKFATAQRKTVT